MNKLCFNKTLILALITAFIFLQWSATHIHLSGEHQHDGDHHQHAVTAHQHQLDNHHANNIDPAADILSHSDSIKVVELEPLCTQFHAKLAELPVITQAASWNTVTQISIPVKHTPFYLNNSYQPYYRYSSIQLRAPPVLS